MCYSSKAMPANHTDYSCYIKVVKKTQSYGFNHTTIIEADTHMLTDSLVLRNHAGAPACGQYTPL